MASVLFCAGHSVVYEQRAGFLLVEQRVSAHVELAQWAGAETFVTKQLCQSTQMQKLSALRRQVCLSSSRWALARELLPELSQQLTVYENHYIGSLRTKVSTLVRAVASFCLRPRLRQYGFPASDCES